VIVKLQKEFFRENQKVITSHILSTNKARLNHSLPYVFKILKINYSDQTGKISSSTQLKFSTLPNFFLLKHRHHGTFAKNALAS